MLQIKNISKTYKTGVLIQKALNGVSLNLRDNEFVAILGPSGSGKTTLLNIIGGLDKYDSGDLIINHISTKDYKDKDWDAYRNHTIGFVFQSYNLIPHQSVLRNVELALTIAGISKKERKARALKALEDVGLIEHAHKKPNQLSGGQMQRVAIARALVNNPSILLADEPTGALDSNTSIQVMELLKQVAKDRLVVMVTHNPDLANEYANRIVRLKDGLITADSNPLIIDEIIEKPKKKRMGKAHMSIFTALSLSFNNLLTKKGRTILTAFAGSVGIIGIALILALSTGFQNYINQIQEDTMSSYPLTIQSETANIFGALLSAHVEGKNEEDGTVKEQMLIQSMMNSVGSNDLKSFKNWLENNTNKYCDDVKQIGYAYSVSPLIYTKDVTNTCVQLNPNTLMSSIYSDSASSLMSSISSSSSMGTFVEYETEKVKNSCELLAGRWPEKYDEVMIVLSQKGKIADLLVYSLGLRDNAELKTLISDVMAGEQSDIHNDPLTFSYEDLLNVKLKLINPSDLYKYNAKYNTYEDMSTDQEYLAKIYESAQDLKVVGIAYPVEQSSIAGVVYSHALVEHVINAARTSPIVRKQLQNKDIDVFSGNRFDENKKESGIEFNDMVSIDEDILKDAFKINIATDDFAKLVKEEDIKSLATKASEDAANSIKGISASVGLINTMLLPKMIDQFELAKNPLTGDYLYLDCNGEDSTLMLTYIDPNEPHNTIKTYEQFADRFINTNILQTSLSLMANYSKELEQLLTMFSQEEGDYEYLTNSLKIAFVSYYDELLDAKYEIDNGLLTVDVLAQDEVTSIVSYGKNQQINKTDLTSSIYSKPEVLKPQTIVINRIVSSLTVGLVGQGAASSSISEATNVLSGLSDIFTGEELMSVDTNKFAEAFNFDMDEDELSRLMTSMITGSSASYSNNLITLGYQDLDEPTSISIYFNDFDSKESFLTTLDEYNQSVVEEKQITYTDITGILISSVQTIVNAVTYVLIAFVSISLIVSSIMIAVITLISVMERTKEIGILRAMGASKANVSNIFNAETFIVGLLSGSIGVSVSYGLTFPINKVIHKLTEIDDINAVVELRPAIVLIIISVVLTMLAGFLPSKKAAKQDPVIALRTE